MDVDTDIAIFSDMPKTVFLLRMKVQRELLEI